MFRFIFIDCNIQNSYLRFNTLNFCAWFYKMMCLITIWCLCLLFTDDGKNIHARRLTRVQAFLNITKISVYVPFTGYCACVIFFSFFHLFIGILINQFQLHLSYSSIITSINCKTIYKKIYTYRTIMKQIISLKTFFI